MVIAIERAFGHHNVLLVSGDDESLFPAGSLDATIVEPLEAAADSPVTKGSHDFWIVFSVGSSGAPDAGGHDFAATPRPLRGAVTAKSPPTAHDVTTMTSQVTTLLQELGHYWLAYPTLQFRWNGQVVSYDQADWVRFNTDTPFQGPLLGGRVNQHWAAWFHSDGSPMGGQNWTDTSRDGRLDRWQWQPRTGPIVRPEGLDPMTLQKKYCDLDLLVMGANGPVECYPETGGRFSWLEPQFVVQPRSTPELQTAYLAGVFLAYSATDYLYFGFDTDHRQLGVYRTNGTHYGSADLGPSYQPGWVHNSGVALRVVRNGTTLYFQARYDESATQDGHAGYSTPLDEQTFLVDTINRLQKSRDWNNTAVVIAYDDSDGWYDHQMSPIVNQSQDPTYDALRQTPLGNNCGSRTDPQHTLGGYQDRCGYGPRLPLLIISRYAKANYVDHTITDQTSILRFIEDNWSTGRLGNTSFDTKASPLTSMFAFEGRQGHNATLVLDPATGQPSHGH